MSDDRYAVISSHDSENYEKARTALREMSALSDESLELTDTIYSAIPDRISEAGLYDSYHSTMKCWAKELGIAPTDVLDLLGSATLVGAALETDNPTDAAMDAFAKCYAFTVRIRLALRLQRDALLGFVELLRFRAFAAFSFVRLQLETAALQRLLWDDAGAARDWLKTYDSDQGLQFHRKYARSINSLLHSWDLMKASSDASGLSLHSRFMGLIPGSLLAIEDMNDSREIGLVFTDIDDAGTLAIRYLQMIAVHNSLFGKLEEFWPDVPPDKFESLPRARHTEVLKQLRIDFHPHIERARQDNHRRWRPGHDA